MDDWELILEYIRLMIEANHLPQWGHYELIDTHKDLDNEDIKVDKMTEKRFEFREINCTAILPKAYDTEKQQYANLFECVHWLNDLHEKNIELEEDLQETMNIIDYLLEELIKVRKENKQIKKQQKENTQFLIKSAKRLGFPSLDHLLYTLDKGEITGYSTANWKNGGMKE